MVRQEKDINSHPHCHSCRRPRRCCHTIQIDPDIDVEQHNLASARTLQVPNIYAIEMVETHWQCVKCSRKILKGTGLVINCDRYGYTIRTSNCSKCRFTAIVVKAQEDLVYLKVFDSVLQAFFPNYTKT